MVKRATEKIVLSQQKRRSEANIDTMLNEVTKPISIDTFSVHGMSIATRGTG